MSVMRAVAAGLRAPVAQWRLVLALWLVRLLPALVVVGWPVYDVASAQLGRHPDAAALLDPGADESGFAYAWTADVERDALRGIPQAMVWLVVVTWLLACVVAGGITARLVHRGNSAGLFAAECGRYAGRFVRLGLIAVVLGYALDVALNAVLASAHDLAARGHHTQDFVIDKAWARGVLFLVLWHLLGMVHAYARIDVVLHERRSALLSWLRGVGLLLLRLPALLVVEVVMLLAAGAAALLAWLLLKGLRAPGADATWTGIGIFLGLAALGSYLRTGIEVGTLDARCHVLAPPDPAGSYQGETVGGPSGDLAVLEPERA